MYKQLYDTCYKGEYNVVINLIKKGVNDWNWGLYEACRGGQKEMAKLMISHGANNWNWGLQGACIERQKEMVLLMLINGANIDNCFLELIDNDIMYLIQKGIKKFGKYQNKGNYFLKLRSQKRALLTYILINDLIGVIMGY